MTHLWVRLKQCGSDSRIEVLQELLVPAPQSPGVVSTDVQHLIHDETPTGTLFYRLDELSYGR